jgi:hypothetical protein
MDVGKAFAAIIGLAMFTTAILPGRQTPQVFAAGGKAVSQVLGTAMGTAKAI